MVVLLIFGAVGVFAASSTETGYTIVSNGCSEDGSEYCENGVCWPTDVRSERCYSPSAAGEFVWSIENPSGSSCCEDSTDLCVANGTLFGVDQYICEFGKQSCNESMTQVQCETPEVEGFYIGGKCICGDGVCSDYTSAGQAICEDDPGNFAEYNFDTTENVKECAASSLVKKIENSSCVWDDEECKTEDVYAEEDYTGIPVRFSCSSVYEIGDCIDGQAQYNRTSEGSVTSGVLTQAELDECCPDASGYKFCGEEIIKLPFFSWFSLVASLVIVGLYYFGSERFKYMRVVN